MKRVSLFTKALAILVLLFGVTSVTTAVFSAWMLDGALTDQFESRGKAISNCIASSSVEILLFRDSATIQAMIEQLQEEGKIQGVSYVFVVDERGAIISHTFFPGIPDEVRNLKGDRHQTTIQPITNPGHGDFIDVFVVDERGAIISHTFFPGIPD